MVDYFSFEDVMKELEVSEEDLKRMVSEGELRAFRDENKMKFKKEDVENLKKGRITEPTIILPSTPAGGQDETVLDLDIQQETQSLKAESLEVQPEEEPAPPPKRAPAPAETSDDLDVKHEETVVGVESDETFIEEESDTGLTTEPLKLADEVETAETVEAESVTEEVAEAPKKAGRSGPRRRVTAQVPMATEEEIEKRRASPVWTVFLLLALMAAIYSGIFGYDLLRMETGKVDQPSNLTAGLANWTLEQFWGDQNWTKFHTRELTQQPPIEMIPVTGGAPIKHRHYSGPTFRESDNPKPPGSN
jgi:hypothetical protein